MTSESHDPERQRADDENTPPEGGEAPAGTAEGADPGEEAAEEATAGGEKTPEERIAELESEASELKDKWMRASADLENQRRRARKDVEEARLDGTKRALSEVLPVVDNLERALEHAGSVTTDEAKGIAEGVGLVMRQFSQALERLNVQPIEAEGKPFDPAVHEAMSQIDTDEVPPGTVAQVLQRGYTLGERLLRPSLVVVAKRAEREESAGPNGKSPDEDAEGEGA